MESVRSHPSFLFITVLLLSILCGAEIDLFVPSFPDLQNSFNLTPFMVEWTLGVNLIAHCVTALFAGTLGDRYGRRRIILYGLMIFIGGSVLCVVASSFSMLLWGRFLQGVGISGPAVLAYVVIADIYSVEKQQAMMGWLNGMCSFSMAFAPVIGSYVNLFFNWRANFCVLLILGIIGFVLSFYFIPKSSGDKNITCSLKEYKIVFDSPSTVSILCILLFLILPYWIFVGLSPILYVNDLGVSLEMFGLYQGVMALTFSILSFTSGFFLGKFGQKKCMAFGFTLVAIFMVSIVVLIMFKVKDPLIITLVMLIESVGVLFPFNILWPVLLDSLPEAKGKTMAVFVSMRLILCALGIQCVSYFYDKTFMPLGVSMFLLLCTMFALIVRSFKKGYTLTAS